MCKVVNKRVEQYDVYIGRGSKWGNPYKIGVAGDRAKVISLYREHLIRQLRKGIISKEDLLELDGKRLGCFCKPHACHGDVLVEAVNVIKEYK